MDFKHTLVKHLLFYVKSRKQLQKMGGNFLERDVIWIVFRTLKKGDETESFARGWTELKFRVWWMLTLYVRRFFQSLRGAANLRARECVCFLHAYSRIEKTSRPPSHAGIKINTGLDALALQALALSAKTNFTKVKKTFDNVNARCREKSTKYFSGRKCRLTNRKQPTRRLTRTFLLPLHIALRKVITECLKLLALVRILIESVDIVEILLYWIHAGAQHVSLP